MIGARQAVERESVADDFIVVIDGIEEFRKRIQFGRCPGGLRRFFPDSKLRKLAPGRVEIGLNSVIVEQTGGRGEIEWPGDSGLAGVLIEVEEFVRIAKQFEIAA